MVYVNPSLPMPAGDAGHPDVPVFRGVDRTLARVWLLTTMGRSGLFERWRIPTATAVAWFCAGEGGGLTYWPDCPDARPKTLPARTNTALVGDNDRMFHRVESIGGPDDDMVRGLTLDSELAFVGDGTWAAGDGERELARYPVRQVRVSVSWKAQVLRDAEKARVVDEHLDDLRFDDVFATFRRDLDARGIDAGRPADPLHDPAFVTTLTRAYHRTPTVYSWRVDAAA
jgi:hypothetical protein